MSVRDDVLSDLQSGPKAETWLVRRHSVEGGPDVPKVLRRMLLDGEIEEERTILEMGMFVPVYRRT